MRMIPSTPYSSESRAEYRVFDRLKTAFSSQPDSGLTAFHSLNLTRHQTKRFGEIDFLIVGKQGIFVIEIKGGAIVSEGGRWYTTGRNGQKKPLRESPFRQAETAMFALGEKVEQSLSKALWDKFVIGYGVIFPDCEFDIKSSEWDRTMVADSRSSRNLEKWLSQLITYWTKKDKRSRISVTDDDLMQLEKFLRPGFETALSLIPQMETLEKRVEELTEDQMRMVDVAEANDRVICYGGAGTGKTFLALELARRWAALGQKVLVVCRSPWLRSWLELHFSIPGVTVALAESATRAARRVGVSKFDALIVDEGQDLLEFDILDKLESVLEGGLSEGRWAFFHDVNNQSGLFGPTDQEALELLQKYTQVKVPLKKNCRNTLQILDKVQATLNADMGAEGTGNGPKVRTHDASTPEHAVEILLKEISYMVHEAGLHPGSITLLSPRPFADSVASQLPGKTISRINILDEYAMRAFPVNDLSYAQITDFKGLENDGVILIDVPQSLMAKDYAAHSYVAMSRPRMLLSIINQG